MFGSHLSVAGGLVNALSAAEELHLDTVQVFTKNQRQWSVPPLDAGAAKEWLAELKRLGWMKRTVSHDSYLINLASPDEALWEKSIDAMREEIERAEALSIPYLVSHPGAHMIKAGPLTPEERIEAGLKRIASAYKRLLKETKGYTVTVCLENTAGGGTTLGRTFEELARLRSYIIQETGSEGERRIGFCVDTCHALAGGCDIAASGPAGKERSRSEGERLGKAMLDQFDEVCGLSNLKVLHLNDSLGDLDSRVDRHAHIGRGKVALGAFAAVVNHPSLKDVPMILETPKEDDDRGVPMDTVNLELLKSLMKEGGKTKRKAAAGR